MRLSESQRMGLSRDLPLLDGRNFSVTSVGNLYVQFQSELVSPLRRGEVLEILVQSPMAKALNDRVYVNGASMRTSKGRFALLPTQ